MDDFDCIRRSSEERFQSAIYYCLNCTKKISFGDNFCRRCGVKFTLTIFNCMKNNLKILSDKNWVFNGL